MGFPQRRSGYLNELAGAAAPPAEEGQPIVKRWESVPHMGGVRRFAVRCLAWLSLLFVWR